MTYILYQSVVYEEADGEPGSMFGSDVTTFYEIYHLIFTVDRNVGLILYNRKHIRSYADGR